jgi:hypothetical protein
MRRPGYSFHGSEMTRELTSRLNVVMYRPDVELVVITTRGKLLLIE